MPLGFARSITTATIGLAVCLVGAAPAVAQPAYAQTASPARAAQQTTLSPEQRDIYAKAFEAIDAGRWDEARRMAARGQHRLADKVIRWLELQQSRSGASFEDIVTFIEANPEWPSQDALARRAEDALVDRGDDSLVLAWFAQHRPATTDGAMRYIDVLLRNGKQSQAIQLVHQTWLSGAFGATQEKVFLSRYRGYLNRDDHHKRLDRLVWEGRGDEARRMMAALVDPGQRALAEARLRLAAMAPGIDGAIRRVPDSLLNDPGLIFERARWRRRKGQDKAATELMRDAPRDLRRPEIWWTERNILVHRAIASGAMSDAYRMVRNHGLTSGPGFVDGEFLAGWIALRFLRQPREALTHFTRLHDGANLPVSRARGAYWAGRAAEALGERRIAEDWYQRAAAYPITYYGQLSLTRLDAAKQPPWPAAPQPTAAERDSHARAETTRVVRLLHEIGVIDRMKPFLLRRVALAQTPAQHALVAEFALSMGRPDLAVSTVKRSAQLAGVMLPHQGWPTVALPAGEDPERALVFATIRQESAFEAAALSSAGARGLMQLMPATARSVARGLGLLNEHRDNRLTADPGYNIRLGRQYLASLIDDFNGSYLLAAAAYNAGPGRVRQWMRDNGDPRQPQVDVIDWIEMIPIEETRNYVQRVFENLHVYRRLLGQTQAAEAIERDLRRRRG